MLPAKFEVTFLFEHTSYIVYIVKNSLDTSEIPLFDVF